jgi:hypothetical protein
VDAMSKMRFEINFLDLLNLILFLVEEIERKKKRFFNLQIRVFSFLTYCRWKSVEMKRQKWREQSVFKLLNKFLRTF